MTAPSASLNAILKMEISPLKSLLDQEGIIALKELQPREKMQIEPQTTDDNDLLWKSYGIFQANDLGIIDLSKQSPSEGSYQGVDPMGLFWSMQHESNQNSSAFKIENASLPSVGPIHYHPLNKQSFYIGGTIACDQHASLDSWNKLIAFFQRTLQEENI